jgi:hypothetical protein
MLAIGIRRRLLIGWGCGILATIGGLMMSSRMDWPPAPAISCVFAVILLGSGLLGSIAHAPKRSLAAAKYAGIGVAFVVGGFCLTAFLKSDLAWSWKAKGHETHGPQGGAHEEKHSDEPAHSHGKPEHGVGGSHSDLVAALWDEHDNVRAKAAEELGKLKDPSVVPDLVKALKDPSTAVKENAAEALGVIGRPEAADGLGAALDVKNEDEWVNLREAEALVRCGGTKGMSALIRMGSEAEVKLVRTEALKKALLYAGRPALKSPEGAEGKAALGELSGWWKEVQSKARWDANAGRFLIAP